MKSGNHGATDGRENFFIGRKEDQSFFGDDFLSDQNPNSPRLPSSSSALFRVRFLTWPPPTLFA